MHMSLQSKLHLGPARHSSEGKTDSKKTRVILIIFWGQPGRKRFVLDRSEPIKVVGDLPELLQSLRKIPSRFAAAEATNASQL